MEFNPVVAAIICVFIFLIIELLMELSFHLAEQYIESRKMECKQRIIRVKNKIKERIRQSVKKETNTGLDDHNKFLTKMADDFASTNKLAVDAKNSVQNFGKILELDAFEGMEL
jgi:hypothetical protein